MRFKSTISLGIGALMLGAGIGPNSAAAAEPLHVRFIMDWAFEGAQAIWPLADDRGCFAKAGLQVTIDRSYGSGDALTKVASGAYDVGVSDFSTLVGFDAKNPDKRLIAFFIVSDIAPMSVVALKESGIAKPADLVGKRIADGAAEASRINFPVFAKANNIDPNSITWITTSPALRQQLLVQKRTDAAAGHMFTILLGLRALGVADKDVTIMKYADYGVDFYGNALMTKPAWAEAHPAAAKAFAACAADGIKASRADPAAAMAALRKRNPLIEDKIELASLDFSNSIAIGTPHVMQDGLSDVTPERLQRTITQSTEALGLPAPKPDEVWTAKYLPPRADLMLPSK
jgi:NitT/TauT family transport system substrate-binding protein